eukprot:TRINITY_DN26313_c0_g1_i1.p1 TRINITY_DN26313_c0_g1~~TRINITY_DN26313_c0_g1_i1.p1  ORF type:complete len:196 (+),score=59.41 TRINITY_DN26313_c0_g1_i1:1-588(+)
MPECVNQCSACVGILERDQQVKPEQLAKILARRGSAYSELQKLPEALHDFKRACSLLPLNQQLTADRDRVAAALHRRTADASFAEGEVELALAEYELGLNLQPDNAGMLANKATCLLQLSRYQECVECCDSAMPVVESKPKMRASVLVRRGSARAKLGSFAAGVEDLKAAIELQPQFAESLSADLEAMQKSAHKQ